MLSQQEIELLKLHGIGHVVIEVNKWVENSNGSAIANWYSQEGVVDMKVLVEYLTLEDRVEFFSYTNFKDWYRDICGDIIRGEVELSLGYNLEQLKYISTDLLSDLIEFKLLSQSFQDIPIECFRRGLVGTLEKFLILLGAKRIFSVATILRYKVELAGAPRWVGLGLSAAPTVEECEQAFLV
jgi:hypothetical protein